MVYVSRKNARSRQDEVGRLKQYPDGISQKENKHVDGEDPAAPPDCERAAPPHGRAQAPTFEHGNRHDQRPGEQPAQGK